MSALRNELVRYLAEMCVVAQHRALPWCHQGMLRCAHVGEFMVVQKKEFFHCLADFPELEEMFASPLPSGAENWRSPLPAESAQLAVAI